jgi:chaperonin GroEL (HSP60 family)
MAEGLNERKKERILVLIPALNEEERMIKSIVDKVVASGASVVICQKGIDDTIFPQRSI